MCRFFYDNKGKWDVGYDAAYLPVLPAAGIDPWALQEVAKCHVPKNDINGAIFFLRREQIDTVYRRIQKLKLEFTPSLCNVAVLGNFITLTFPYPSFRFDRIDIQTLQTYAIWVWDTQSEAYWHCSNTPMRTSLRP
jgi:hypothetical protein